MSEADLSAQEVALFERERRDYAELLDAIRTPLCRLADATLQITSIGATGGGASVVTGQPCGGFLLRHADRTIVVDPGDNSMSNLIERGFNPFEITDVLASHTHNDHVGDLSIAVSAAINLGLPERQDARIVAAPPLLDYANPEATRFGFTLPSYAWQANVVSLFARRVTTTRFDGAEIVSQDSCQIGNAMTIRATEARHGGTPVTGFLIDTALGRIGYTSDTEFFDGLADQFAGSDLLWMNMNTLALDAMLPGKAEEDAFARPIHNHLGYVGACRLIASVKPRTAIVTHLGEQLRPCRAELEALLRARFGPDGIHVHCPETLDCFTFRGALGDAPERATFRF